MKKMALLLLFSLFIISSCNKESNPIDPNDTPNNSGKLLTGDVIEEFSESVSPSGATLTVNNSDSPINGFTLTVPQNSYNNTRTYSISYAEISGHEFGDIFNPISPLIIIKNGGGYSNQPIEVKVPIKKNEDEFAIGFFYDEITGKLEALPAITQDDSSITIITRHFATSTISNGISLNKKMDGSSLGNLVISTIKESALSSQAIVSTGFIPGIDDWEFINYGSYIASGGHCAGQATTAMWYFYEKKLKGDPPLFHRFDKFNESTKPGKLWQDNPQGYRFASTIQNDFDWDGWIRNVNIQSYLQPIAWKTFIAAILMTGEPQSVIIKESATNAGHAMIVYKINISEGKLYIADPNYPNNRGVDGTESIRTIKYTNGKFEPYASYLKVGDPGTVFDQIAFFGKTSNIDWSQIQKRYTEMENGIVGNDRFPKYKLYVKSEDGDIEFKDGMIIADDSIKIYSRSTECTQWLNGTDHYQVIRAYDEITGNSIAAVLNKGVRSYPLKPGKNSFGLEICGAKNGDAYNFLDFQWITVYNQKLFIEPDPLEGEPKIEYELTAFSGGTAPKGNAKYVWSFGDNTNSVTMQNDSTVKHTYENEGEYDITVELFENSSGKKLGEASSVAVIAKPNELNDILKTMNKMRMDCSFDFTNDMGGSSSTGVNVIPYNDAFIQWNGNSFIYKHTETGQFDNMGWKSNSSTTVMGTISQDTKTLLTITYDLRNEYYRNFELDEVNTEKMTLTNVPQSIYPGYVNWGGDEYDYFQYELNEEQILAHTTFLEWHWTESSYAQETTITKSHIDDFWAPLIIKIFKE